MSNSLRTRQNAALEHAAHLSATLGKPLRIIHPIPHTAQDGHAWPERHAIFHLQSLVDVATSLSTRHIPFAPFLADNHPSAIARLATRAAAIVTDTAYLRPGISDRKAVAAAIKIPLFVVEADVIVPVATVSDKSEYAARTIRPKITNLMSQYLVTLPELPLAHNLPCNVSEWLQEASLVPADLSNFDHILEHIPNLDRGASPVSAFRGGQDQAEKVLHQFLKSRIAEYATGRNEPVKQKQSDLSPYLRAGNISPVVVVMRTRAHVGKKTSLKESQASFLEELIVRRELSVNACWFNPDGYDVYESIVPNFARESLELHKADERGVVYSYEELEAAVTNDVFWNAAQLEMIVRGKMHGYMRMYWAKQIIGWVNDPKQAMHYTLRLNNRWELDAVDPNSFVGVMWCYGLHDRGWKERPIWGKVRYMNEAGLKRKFNMAAYVAMVDRMVASEGLPKHIADLRTKYKMKKKQGTLTKYMKKDSGGRKRPSTDSSQRASKKRKS